MRNHTAMANFISFLLILVLTSVQGKKDESSLQLIHVLFRHGNRTPNGPEELYPNDPHSNFTYSPFGLGQLTNAGKKHIFNLGNVLRQRYNSFLGNYYYPELVDARSTDYNRTKMSLELVLAGLFPPKGEQIWHRGINWQPIPYNYLPRDQDQILLGVLCPYYLELYKEQVNSPKFHGEFKDNQDIINYISENSGLNITTFEDVYYLNFGLTTQDEWGLELPAWTELVWPEIMNDLAVKEYNVATATTELKSLAIGYFLEKIIKDTQAKITGLNQETKIYLYSGHESNLAEFLLTLDVFQPHIPPYGAYITIEIHRIQGIYGLKIYYENYTKNKPELLTLPGCDDFCPFSQFIKLVEEYIPSEDLCGKDGICSLI